MSEESGVPLRPTMLVAVLVLIVLAAGGVGLLAYQSSRSIVSEMWEDLSDQIAHGTTERALRYFESAKPYVELTRRQAERHELDIDNDQKLLDYFRSAVEANPEFTWASFGRADGSYVAVHRRHDGRGIEGHVRRPGPAQVFALEGDEWIARPATASDYDPRTRPWYRRTLESDGGAWVDPFVFATVNAPGFAYVHAHRIGTQTLGVWAVEYDVSELSEYLSELQVGTHGKTYILTHDGHVVGHPEGVVSTEGDTPMIAQAAGHRDASLARAWSALEGETQARLAVDDLLVLAERFPSFAEIDWMAIIIVRRACD